MKVAWNTFDYLDRQRVFRHLATATFILTVIVGNVAAFLLVLPF